MTKSLTYNFTPAELTAIVSLGPNGQNHSPLEVIIVNTSSATLYLGDRTIFDDETGIAIAPTAGVALSVGPGDELYGYASSNISLNVMKLFGKVR